MFRGRETTHPERGEQLLMRLAEDVEDLGTIEQRPSLDGRNMTMVMNPLKAKERKPEPDDRSKRGAARRKRPPRPRRPARSRRPRRTGGATPSRPRVGAEAEKRRRRAGLGAGLCLTKPFRCRR